MPDELRLFRLFAVIIAAWLALCFVLARIVWGAQPTAYNLYVPVVTKPDCNPQSWKGLAGFEDNGDGSRAICVMHVSSVYAWQQVYAHPYTSAYPLPSQPIDMVRFNPNGIFVGFNGMSCNGDRLACVADAVRGKGQTWMLFGNEPDNPEAAYGDAISPDALAQDFKVFSDTVLSANPQVQIVALNLLFPCGDYQAQFISAFIARYGMSPESAIYAFGKHTYGNVGVHGSDVMGNFDAALACAVAGAAGKPLWITEWGADSTAAQENAFDASFVPAMCAALSGAGVEKAFLFIGSRWQSAIKASVLNADGSLSAVGSAYAAC